MPDRFLVPQFIEVESKVFLFITARQFVVLLVGSMFIFIWYKLFDFSLFAFMTFITGSLTLIFAFAKINGQLFHYFLLNIIITLKRPSLRVWQKTRVTIRKFQESKKKKEFVPETSLTSVRLAKGRSLSDLSLIVNTGGRYKGE